MKVAIIRYNAGNVQSVVYALERLGVTPLWTDDHEVIAGADKVIFPGQGEASTTMAYLQHRPSANVSSFRGGRYKMFRYL